MLSYPVQSLNKKMQKELGVLLLGLKKKPKGCHIFQNLHQALLNCFQAVPST